MSGFHFSGSWNQQAVHPSGETRKLWTVYYSLISNGGYGMG